MLGLALLLLLFGYATADMFTAVADMERMLTGEKEITNVIESYIQEEQRRLDELKRFADEVLQSKDAADVGPDFVANPVNAYLLIKRLTSEWKKGTLYLKVEHLMRNNMADSFIQNITANRVHNQVKFPEKEDLSSAAAAIHRLQAVYKLDSVDIADGIILGEKVSHSLTAHNAFEIGLAAYNQDDYYHALTWMQTALNKLENEEEKTIPEEEILEYLAFSLYQQGNIRRALALTEKLAQISPNHPRAKGNLKWYEETLQDKDMEGELPPIVNKRVANDDNVERDAYEALCRGETPKLDPSKEKLLYCYLKMDRPFLRLAPIKVEILLLDPLVVLFKEVLSEYEMEVIKTTATPKLKRATFPNAKTGDPELSDQRICKIARLKEDEHEVLARVNRRVEDMTNLNQKTSEELQVGNYGFGGHYDPHFDFAREEDKMSFIATSTTGNRIATVLFYMAKPEHGGATVFDQLGTAVFPSKGDALFWYNLLKSGERDMRTRHAACPVLLGVKWVSNKWIREHGQEFTRPCGLDETVQERFVGDLSPTSRTKLSLHLSPLHFSVLIIAYLVL